MMPPSANITRCHAICYRWFLLRAIICHFVAVDFERASATVETPLSVRRRIRQIRCQRRRHEGDERAAQRRELR